MHRSPARTARPAVDPAVAPSRRGRALARPVLRGAVTAAVVTGFLAAGGPASATHSHVIQTPGTCVDKAGAGFGTGEDHASGTGPTFHSQVHKGTPGTFAFERPGNPVAVVGGTLCD